MTIFVRLIIAVSFFLSFFNGTPPPKPKPMDTLQLRYNVQAGTEFKVQMVMEGKMSTKVFQIDQVEEAERSVTYELVSMQRVESETDDRIIVTRIKPIPETVFLSINGMPQEVDLELLPEALIRMTRLGEIVELKFITSSTEIALGKEVFGLIGISNAFPRFPEKKIKIGDTWELFSTTPDTMLEGMAKLLGFEQVQGRQCAIIQIHSSMPITVPKELESSFASQGMSVIGKMETEMTQYFALEIGWPLRGIGKTFYETTLIRNGEKVTHTTYNFDVNFITTF